MQLRRVSSLLLCCGFLVSGLGCDDDEHCGEPGYGADCKPICGDGTLVAGEECENYYQPESCDQTCHCLEGYVALDVKWTDQPQCTLVCGDGFIAAYECDGTSYVCGGKSQSPDCGVCGDGKVDATNIRDPWGPELCDDGNTDNGDGCSYRCLPDSGFTCSGTPSTCVATGLDPALRMEDLTREQIETWCAWVLDWLGPGGNRVNCESGSYLVASVEECTEHYLQGLPSDVPWWCGHARQGLDYDCGAMLGGTSPLQGCTVGEAEVEMSRLHSELLETDEYIDHDCPLFEGGGYGHQPVCSTHGR